MSLLMHGGQHVRKHPWRKWWMLFHASILTVVVRVALATFSFRRVIRVLRRAASWFPQWGEVNPRYRQRAVWAASAVGRRFLPERPCLTQAVVLEYLLLRRGDRSCDLHIGVAKNKGDGFRAHAWVERDGRVLIGGRESPSRYTRFRDLETKM